MKHVIKITAKLILLGFCSGTVSFLTLGLGLGGHVPATGIVFGLVVCEAFRAVRIAPTPGLFFYESALGRTRCGRRFKFGPWRLAAFCLASSLSYTAAFVYVTSSWEWTVGKMAIAGFLGSTGLALALCLITKSTYIQPAIGLMVCGGTVGGALFGALFGWHWTGMAHWKLDGGILELWLAFTAWQAMTLGSLAPLLKRSMNEKLCLVVTPK